MNIQKFLDLILIAGFVLVDWLILHDIFKAGETLTTTEHITVFLSAVVFISAGPRLLKK